MEESLLSQGIAGFFDGPLSFMLTKIGFSQSKELLLGGRENGEENGEILWWKREGGVWKKRWKM